MKSTPLCKHLNRFASLLGVWLLVAVSGGAFWPSRQALADPGQGGGVPALRDSISIALQELREIKALLLSEKNDPKWTATVCFDVAGEVKAAGEMILDGRLKVEGFGGVDIYGTGLKLKPDVGGQARGVMGIGGKSGVSYKVCAEVPLPSVNANGEQDVFVSAIAETGDEVSGRLPDVAARLGWSPESLQARITSALSQVETLEFSPEPGQALVGIREKLPDLLASMPMNDAARTRLQQLPEPPTSLSQLNPLNDEFMFEVPAEVDQLLDEVRDKAESGQRLKSTIETIAEICCNICGRVDGECDIDGCGSAYAGESNNETGGSKMQKPVASIELTPLAGEGGTSSIETEGAFGLFQVPNPARPGVQLGFSLASPAPAELSVFSVDGRQVRRLVAADLGAGPYTVAWDGSDDSGVRVSSGVYLLRLVASGRVDSKKIILAN